MLSCIMSDYLTLEKEAVAEFVEKRSRFIGYAKPVKTQEEAMDFIKNLPNKLVYDEKKSNITIIKE